MVGKDWSAMKHQEKVLIIVLIIGNWTSMLMAFVSNVNKKLSHVTFSAQTEQIMKNIKTILLLGIATIGIIGVLVGCVTARHAVVTVDDNGISHTNYVSEPSPWVGQAQGAVTTVSPLIPAPFGSILAIGGTLLGVAASAFAAHKNKQSNNWQSVATTVIEGVEAADAAVGKKIKEVIASTANNKGTSAQVDAAVQKIVN